MQPFTACCLAEADEAEFVEPLSHFPGGLEPRLDHLADDGFDEKKQGQGSERHAPPRIDRHRQGHGKTSGDQRPEIGDEPQQERDDAPGSEGR